jgi:hypothetical protein
MLIKETNLIFSAKIIQETNAFPGHFFRIAILSLKSLKDLADEGH